MTNLEYLKSLNDEDLCKFIGNMCAECADGSCPDVENLDESARSLICATCCTMWLKSPRVEEPQS